MASVVDICNIGMHRLGLDDIASLIDGTQKARLVAACYDQKRELMLEDNVWSFARKRATLAPSATAPVFTTDFPYAFQLPADYLRLVNTSLEEWDYLIEGGFILYGSNVLSIRYIANITDPNLMSAGFREALGLRIANELCVALTGSATLQQAIQREYAAIVNKAGSVDAQSNGEGIPPEDEWLMARG